MKVFFEFFFPSRRNTNATDFSKMPSSSVIRYVTRNSVHATKLRIVILVTDGARLASTNNRYVTFRVFRTRIPTDRTNGAQNIALQSVISVIYSISVDRGRRRRYNEHVHYNTVHEQRTRGVRLCTRAES